MFDLTKIGFKINAISKLVKSINPVYGLKRFWNKLVGKALRKLFINY